MKCTQLTRLILNNNKITGTIPSSISDLKELHTLYIHNNHLSGEIPPEICDLGKSLTLLNLSHNELIGVIPQNIGTVWENVYICVYFS